MLTVRDIMTEALVSVSPELPLRETVDLFADEHVSGAPVVAGGRVVGVLSASDVLSFQASMPGVPAERREVSAERDQTEMVEDGQPEEREGDEPVPAFFTEMWADAGADVAERFSTVESPEWDPLAEHTVSEAMSRRLFTVRPETEVAQAAESMVRTSAHRLLVMDGSDLVGIVTAWDVMRAVADRRLT